MRKVKKATQLNESPVEDDSSAANSIVDASAAGGKTILPSIMPPLFCGKTLLRGKKGAADCFVGRRVQQPLTNRLHRHFCPVVVVRSVQPLTSRLHSRQLLVLTMASSRPPHHASPVDVVHENDSSCPPPPLIGVLLLLRRHCCLGHLLMSPLLQVLPLTIRHQLLPSHRARNTDMFTCLMFESQSADVPYPKFRLRHHQSRHCNEPTVFLVRRLGAAIESALVCRGSAWST